MPSGWTGPLKRVKTAMLTATVDDDVGSSIRRGRWLQLAQQFAKQNNNTTTQQQKGKETDKNYKYNN